MFHTLSEEELTFPYSSAAQFKDMEGVTEDLDIDPASIRRQYLDQLTAYLSELKSVCRKVPADYTLFNTKEAYEVVLRSFFVKRMGGAR